MDASLASVRLALLTTNELHPLLSQLGVLGLLQRDDRVLVDRLVALRKVNALILKIKNKLIKVINVVLIDFSKPILNECNICFK